MIGRYGQVLMVILLVAICLCLENAAFIPHATFFHLRSITTAKPIQFSKNALQIAKDPELNKEEINLPLLDTINNVKTERHARRVLEAALTSGGRRFNSISIPAGASVKGVSDGDLAIQTRLVNKKYKIMDLIELSGDRDADRASLFLLCLVVGSFCTAVVANENLPGPEIIRFIVVWLLSFAPLFFVGYGIAGPEKLQSVLVAVQREAFPAYRKRMIQHEAGHFLMGHLLGWPVAGYRANAVKNAVEFYSLQDIERGSELARQLGFDAPTRAYENGGGLEEKVEIAFFGEGGRGGEIVERQSVFRNAKNYRDNPFLKLPSQNEPSNSWPFRGFDEATLDKLTAISVAGVCSEILAFGNAEGGVADLSQLRQIFASSESEMTEREMENRIRYALGYTMSQLRQHLGVLDALAAVMERNGSIAECVAAIEGCFNVTGQDPIMGDSYELRRRKAFREKGIGLVERILLGGDRNVDTDEDRMVEGKGGGYRKQTFRLSGDDPFYLALATAMGFLAWASSGGLSLH